MKRMRRASVHPTSADVNLSEDLILDILSRLPTATLARFKRVCKDWRRRLIPRILAHRPNLAFIVQLPDLMPRFLCYSHDGGVRQDLCFHSLFDSWRAYSCFPDDLLNLCNGMALARIQPYPRHCSMFQFYDDPHLELDDPPDPKREYIVINPVTGRRRIIPSPPAVLSTSSSTVGLINHILAFDPRRSSRHFKVVAFTDFFLELEPEPEPEPEPEAPFLYSSRTKRWRRLEEPAPLSCNETDWALNESSYCLNGRAYRIAQLCFTRLMGVQTLHACIAVFHVEEESLTWITSPGAAASAAVREDHRCKCSLGESGGGRLFYAYRGVRFLWVWMLEDCSSGGRWSLRHRVDVGDAYPRCWPSVSCLAFHPEDADVVFLTISESLYIFDLKRANPHQVRKLGQEHSGCLVHPFLCSPKLKSSSSSRPSYHHSWCDCDSLEEY